MNKKDFFLHINKILYKPKSLGFIVIYPIFFRSQAILLLYTFLLFYKWSLKFYFDVLI